jgi:hypothetical protein
LSKKIDIFSIFDKENRNILLEFLDIFNNVYKQIKENEGKKKQKGVEPRTSICSTKNQTTRPMHIPLI